MRWEEGVAAVIFAVLLCVIVVAVTLSVGTPEPKKEPLKHAYYPFTVEVEVRDR